MVAKASNLGAPVRPIVSITVLFLLAGAFMPAHAAERYGRRGLFSKDAAFKAAESDDSKPASPFTLGTLAGVAIGLHDPTTYTVRNDIIVIDQPASWTDYGSIGGYALPSVALVNVGKDKKKSLSLIAPLGGSSKEGGAAGVGVSLDFSSTDTSQVGLALAVVGTSIQRLSAGQRASLQAGSTLDPADTVIGSGTGFQVALGVYVAPKFSGK